MGNEQKTPVLLMVSGGSDSEAMLELAYALVASEASQAPDELLAMMASALPDPRRIALAVLHVNHMLRGADADADEAFVARRCEELGVPCEARRVDVAAAARESGEGMEATARAVRYRLADEALGKLCQQMGVAPDAGIICTAHTLDDRIETFYMRSLVGTGPGGLGSIPRARGHIVRPLLDATREQLRDWLRAQHPGMPDESLWREDATNDDGSNFRSRVRGELVPVLRALRPGFEKSLARTMDLIASEDEELAAAAESVLYRNMAWDGETAQLPCEALRREIPTIARRTIRAMLLAVNPDARLESGQIEQVRKGCLSGKFALDVSGGIRVTSDGATLTARLVE